MSDLRIKTVQGRREVTLTVDNRPLTAYAGETLLAALVAAGIKSQKDSPVRHEKRGGLCGMGVCYECLVTLNGVPNVRACMTEVEDGMVVVTHG
jgi:D-hydroxyproline dehydrogenase subunit gamma